MIRIILFWLVLSVVIGAGIMAFNKLSGQEKWQLTKTVAYATMCSLVAVMIMMAVVVAF